MGERTALLTASILDELLAVLPADAPLRGLAQGPRACAVWSRNLGLASACPAADLIATADAAVPDGPAVGGGTARLADLARSPSPRQAALGLAALNSLLEVDRAALQEGRAQDLLASVGTGRRVCLVGHFPFVEELRRRVGKLVVLELVPGEGDLPASAADDEIPAADLVAITSTALVNHTLEGLLELARGKLVVLVGPSTPLHPALFEHGVCALCGSLAIEPASVLASVRSGLSFRRCSGLRRVVLTRRPTPLSRSTSMNA